MAAPHACGVAALYLASHPAASAAEVNDALKSRATQGIVSGALSAENDLLHADVADLCGDAFCSVSSECGTCAADCTSCAPAACGDGACNGTETCSSCAADCGACSCKAPGQSCSTGNECCSGNCGGSPRNRTCRS
jgi:hypothetical protein